MNFEPRTEHQILFKVFMNVANLCIYIYLALNVYILQYTIYVVIRESNRIIILYNDTLAPQWGCACYLIMNATSLKGSSKVGKKKRFQS